MEKEIVMEVKESEMEEKVSTMEEKIYRKNIEEKFCDWLERFPKLHDFYVGKREIIVYLIVGGLNTLVSLGAFWICAKTLLDANVPWQNVMLNSISWLVGVIFGYVMNRIYVFRSHDPKVIPEFLKFAGGRVATWGSDTGMMLLMVNVLHWNIIPFGNEAIPYVLRGERGEVIPKIISSVVVVILNYVISKLLVFRKPKAKKENTDSSEKVIDNSEREE